MSAKFSSNKLKFLLADKREKNQQKQLLDLAASGNAGELAKFLASMPMDYSLNSVRGSVGGSVLHSAALGGCCITTALLLEKGANVSLTTAAGETPLHFACKRGDLQMVKLLVERGAELDALTIYDLTPLHWAVQYDFAEIVQYLIDAGSDLELRVKYGRSTLQLALAHEDCLKTLLRNGGDVMAVDEFGWTPLHAACEKGLLDAVKLLLEYGSDFDAPDYQLRTPLHHAAQAGHHRVVEVLLGYGAFIDSRDEDDTTPLHRAVSWRRGKVARVLIENDADIFAKTGSGRTVRNILIEVSDCEDVLDIVNERIAEHEYELEYLRDPNYVDKRVERLQRTLAKAIDFH